MSKLSSLFMSMLFTAAAASGQGLAGDVDRAMQLHGRHSVQIKVGFLNATSDVAVTIGGAETDIETGGLQAFIAYSYWLRDDIAIGASLGLMDVGSSVSVRTGGVNSKSAEVIPILLRGTLYPQSLAIGPNVYPFISLAVGPYFGSATRTETEIESVVSETVVETAFGGRLLAGVEWFASNRFRLSVDAGYQVMTDFDQQIGSDDNFSGPQFSVGLGVML